MIYKLKIPAPQVKQLERFVGMAKTFKPDIVETAVLKVVREDDLTDEDLDAGIGMILYADEPTYKMALQYGGSQLASAEVVDSFPPEAEDFIDS